ncbi:hypothetical protein BJX68DRAFT_82894 [Aspergillus pseudodeflectus]|uniref:Uncharacterized protein n=1 Tax=Aspergillus pseudodeflectus TaxID=176178 RepID=A0ABR4L724_9EURO
MDLDSILRTFTTSAKTWVAGKYPPEEPLFDQLSLGPLLLSNCPSPRLFKVKIIPKSHMRPTPKSINADPTLYQDRWYLTPDAEEMVFAVLWYPQPFVLEERRRLRLVPSLGELSLRNQLESCVTLPAISCSWISFCAHPPLDTQYRPHDLLPEWAQLAQPDRTSTRLPAGSSKSSCDLRPHNGVLLRKYR